METWKYNDGGRKAAGYKGSAGDCVVRSIAIATGRSYSLVYNELEQYTKTILKKDKGATPRNGVPRKVYEEYLKDLGWKWVPTMQIGSGCTTHLKADELPSGSIIARLSRHLAAVVDGVIQDTYDPSREGTRCVYGYFIQE